MTMLPDPAYSKRLGLQFCVTPLGRARADAARMSINAKAIQQLGLLAREYERATGESMVNAIKALRRINCEWHVDPSLHAAADLALRAMEFFDGDGCDLESIRIPLQWASRRIPREHHDSFYGLNLECLSVSASVANLSSRHGLRQMGLLGSHSALSEEPDLSALEPSALRITLACETIVRVLNDLHRASAALHEEIVGVISRIILFEHRDYFGASHRSTFGEIYLTVPTDICAAGLYDYFVEHVVHEASHNLLFALMSSDPLVLNDSQELFDAPLRRDKRPIYGIFHASFVIVRILQAFSALRAVGIRCRNDAVEHFLPKLEVGLRVLREHATLTSPGKSMLGEMLDYAVRCRDLSGSH